MHITKHMASIRCELYSSDLSKRYERHSLLGDVSGIREFYAELFDSVKDHGCSSPSTTCIHGFLSDETACVCRSCILLFKRNRELKEKVDRLFFQFSIPQRKTSGMLFQTPPR